MRYKTKPNQTNFLEKTLLLNRVIVCLEVRESRSLYIHIYIFIYFLKGFWHTVQRNKINFETDLFEPVRVIVDLGVVETIGRFTLLRSPKLEP